MRNNRVGFEVVDEFTEPTVERCQVVRSIQRL
jgi:hypothetical protein